MYIVYFFLSFGYFPSSYLFFRALPHLRKYSPSLVVSFSGIIKNMTSADRIDFEMEVEVESASSGPAVDAPNPSSPAPVTPGGVKNVVVTTATTGSVTVSLHPLVIMNVSEHWTRLRAQEGSPQTGIYVLSIHPSHLFIVQ